MGVLGHQPERASFYVTRATLRDEIEESQELAHQYEIPVADVIALRAVLAQERANDIAVQDGDFRDEYVAGIGECLDRIASAILESKEN